MDVKKLYEKLEPATSFLTGESEITDGIFIVDNSIYEINTEHHITEEFCIMETLESARIIGLGQWAPYRMFNQEIVDEFNEDLSPAQLEVMLRLEGYTQFYWFLRDSEFSSYKDVAPCGINAAQMTWEKEEYVFVLCSKEKTDNDSIDWGKRMVAQAILRDDPWLFYSNGLPIKSVVQLLLDKESSTSFGEDFYNDSCEDCDFSTPGRMTDLISMDEGSKAYCVPDRVLDVDREDDEDVYLSLVEIMSVMKAQGKPLDDLLDINGFVEFFEEYDNDD